MRSSLATARTRRRSLDAVNEPAEVVVIFESGAEVHPGEAAQEAWEFFALRLQRTGEEDGDDPEGFVADPVLQSGAHLFVLPGTKTGGAYEDGAGAALVQRLLQSFLPGLTRDEVPLVEEWLDPCFDELVGERLHHRFVGGAVAEEDVVAIRHSVWRSQR